MARTVTVNLEADVAGFLAPVLEAEKATDKLDKKVEDLDRDIDKLGRDSVVAGAEVGVLGDQAKKTSEDVDGLGKKTEESGKKTSAAAEESGKLKIRIEELRTSVSDLAKEFDRTGDPALLKKFRADSSELAGLTKMRKEFEDAKPKLQDLNNEADRGSGIWSKLTGWIGAGRQALLEFGGKGGTGPEVAGPFAGGLTSPVALGVGAAALGPALAAAGGAIGALGGAGGAGLGVAGAVMGNPQAFSAAWSSATGEVKKDLIDAGAAFSGPTMEAIRSIGPTVAGWHLKEALAPAAQYVPELVKGVEGFATGVERGFADLVANAGPEVAVLSQGMVQLGDAVGSAFSSIASGAQGGAQALHDTITIVSDLVIAIGGITGASEKAFGFIHDHPIMSALMTGGLSLGITAWDMLAGSADKAGQSVADAGSAAAAAGPDFAALSSQLTATKVDADSLAESMSLKVLNTMMSLDQATLHWDESLTKISTTLKKNGTSLDEHTVKGQANVKEILAAVQANISAYQANVNAGMGAEAAAKAYDDNTAALERQLKKMGFTQSAVDGLIGKYRGVPKKIDTDIAINGLTDAINNLADLMARLNHIDGHNYHSTVTTDYIDNRKSTYSQQVPGYSDTVPVHNPKPHAAGGILDAGWSLVGEEGPELVRSRIGGQQVYTAAQTRSMMASSLPSSSGGGFSGAVQLTYSGPTGGLDGLHLSWLAEASRQGRLQIHARSVVS